VTFSISDNESEARWTGRTPHTTEEFDMITQFMHQQYVTMGLSDAHRPNAVLMSCSCMATLDSVVTCHREQCTRRHHMHACIVFELDAAFTWHGSQRDMQQDLKAAPQVAGADPGTGAQPTRLHSITQ
jgi:hypothetical protein